jgi:hypothetical protein
MAALVGLAETMRAVPASHVFRSLLSAKSRTITESCENTGPMHRTLFRKQKIIRTCLSRNIRSYHNCFVMAYFGMIEEEHAK